MVFGSHGGGIKDSSVVRDVQLGQYERHSVAGIPIAQVAHHFGRAASR
jgi:hypothetical protein